MSMRIGTNAKKPDERVEKNFRRVPVVFGLLAPGP